MSLPSAQRLSTVQILPTLDMVSDCLEVFNSRTVLLGTCAHARGCALLEAVGVDKSVVGVMHQLFQRSILQYASSQYQIFYGRFALS